MKITPLLFTATALVIAPHTRAATDAGLQAEYAQVRKIALKDPGVRAAFAKASDKLNARIVQIDPALKPLIEHPPAAPDTHRAAAPSRPRAAASTGIYVVAKGDTLTSIAARNHITVAALKSANAIADERKLQPGQALNLPAQKGQ